MLSITCISNTASTYVSTHQYTVHVRTYICTLPQLGTFSSCLLADRLKQLVICTCIRMYVRMWYLGIHFIEPMSRPCGLKGMDYQGLDSPSTYVCMYVYRFNQINVNFENLGGLMTVGGLFESTYIYLDER